MSLRFIYGRSGSGKSHFCFENIKFKLENGVKNNLILIVPEQFSFQSEKKLIEKIGATGIINTEVLSFKRLAYKVFGEVGGVTRKHMDASGKCMLIYKIMNDIKEELKVFNTAAKQEGFTNTISQLITEFKNYNVSAEMLNETVSEVDDELLASKIKDINYIYTEFERILHKGYIDTDDDLTILYEKIDESVFLNNAEIWIDEFNSFTPQQYNIIEKLLKKVKRVNITLCMNGSKEDKFNTDIFMLTQKTEKKLLEIAMDNNIKIDKPIELYKKPYPRFKNSREMSYLENNFFRYPCKIYTEKTKDIKIFKALNSYTEIENTAKDIIRLCREEGYRFRDIAVVTRDIELYENVVRAVFSEYEIPYFIDKKKEIDNEPLIILMKSVIEIFTKNWSYEVVFRYLKSGLLNVNKEDVDLLENYVLACGIRGRKKWMDEKDWDYVVSYSFENEEDDEKQKEILERINSIRRIIIKPLINFYSNITGKKNVRELCTALFEFLCDIEIPQKIHEWVEDFKQKGEQDLVREYSQIWNLVVELLDQAVEVLGDEVVTLDQFVKILSVGFNMHKMGLIPPALDQILVSSVERIKGHDIKALYLIGVNDGIFPKANNEEGIFNDSDRINLKDKGIELASDTKTQAFEEQFLIYTTLTITAQYLRLSYPVADFEGKALRPSIIISRMKNIFPKIHEKSDVLGEIYEDDFSWISRPVPTFNKLISMMRDNIEGKNVNPIWKDVYSWYINDEEWKEKFQIVSNGFNYNNQVKNIDEKRVRKLYGKVPKFSVSRLEKYAQCPFGYYVQYGLKAKDRKIFKLSSPDIGTFMHKVIDDFSETVEKNGLHWGELTKEWCENTISYTVDNIIESTSGSILKSSSRYRYFTERLKRVLTRAVELIVAHMQKSGFEPLGYEMIFGEGGEFPPIEIELTNGEKIKLIGRIDRVDKLMCEDGIFYRIIDYKSGKQDFKLSDVYYGLQIQLLTYLDAIIDNANKVNNIPSLPAGVLYFKIEDPIIKANKSLSEEEIEKEIMKKLKMKGLLLADTEIVKQMDKDMEGISLIIPAELKKDGNLSGRSSIATKEQFDELRKHVRNNLIKACEEMLKGDITIKPYRKKDSVPCKFCMYSSICQFDPDIKNNNYKLIKEKKDKEIWELLEQEKNENKMQEGENNDSCKVD
ncbi:helicase-exonuclease AddAB subunit AddB [Haloimpatiens sp. FM7330]|uniref:helicase-exonuclease AddAB subunit AddB n=1 Tax=Haloimpatiens sp. FM7330 TaxID=3298610 RepID=UPI0036265E23